MIARTDRRIFKKEYVLIIKITARIKDVSKLMSVIRSSKNITIAAINDVIREIDKLIFRNPILSPFSKIVNKIGTFTPTIAIGIE
jgi:hypothetical protein